MAVAKIACKTAAFLLDVALGGRRALISSDPHNALLRAPNIAPCLAARASTPGPLGSE